MPGSRTFPVLLLAATLLAPAFAGPRQPRAGAGAKPTAAAAAPRPQPRQAAPHPPRQQNAPARQPDNHPGEQVLDKLSRMTPQEREAALARFPPERRAMIENRIRNFQRLPPEAQSRTLNQLERFNRLPLQRQNQVRRAMKQYEQIPEERKAIITQEMQRIAAMPDQERRAHMNTEEFRNRYSPAEQQMMSNLAEVLPSRE